MRPPNKNPTYATSGIGASVKVRIGLRLITFVLLALQCRQSISRKQRQNNIGHAAYCDVLQLTFGHAKSNVVDRGATCWQTKETGQKLLTTYTHEPRP